MYPGFRSHWDGPAADSPPGTAVSAGKERGSVNVSKCEHAPRFPSCQPHTLGRELCRLLDPGHGWEWGSRSVPGKHPAGLCSPAVADKGLLVGFGDLTQDWC